jgi:TolA-binding protein
MSVTNLFRTAAIVAALAVAAPVTAQTVTTNDIQRLQDQVYDASNEVSRLRSRDQQLADRLQDQLDDVRDEVVYLRVKLRKEGSISRTDYNDVRTRVDSIRAEARNESARQGTGSFGGSSSGYGSGSGSAPSGSAPSGYGSGSGSNTGYGDNRQSTQTTRRNEIPAGQEIDVRLERELSSETAQVEDRFTATTMVDLYQGNDVLIPAGSTMRGVVSSVSKATRTDRKGSLTVAFDQVTVRGRSYPIRATVTQALESEGIKGEAAKIGAGAGVGAIIGGILGGAKGALLGVLIGGGGTIAATEGTNVKLPAGTVLRVRFDQPLQLR